MHIKPVFIPLLACSLAACAQTPVGNTPQAAADVAAEPAARAVSLLTPELMSQILLAEVAAQRGGHKLAAESYADLAERTRDARAARRATELAVRARLGSLALRSARLWQTLEPESPKALQMLATMLVGNGQLQDARPFLEGWVASGKPEVTFLQMHGLFARVPDRQAVAALVAEVAARYPALPEARFAVAQSAWQAGQTVKTLAALDEALRLNPGWERAALFKAQVLQHKEGDAAAMAFMAEFASQHPTALELRLALARQFARSNRSAEAREAFLGLTRDAPKNPEPHFALGLLAMQGNELARAKEHFLQAQALDYQDEGSVQYILAQIAEAQGAHEEAIDRYKNMRGTRQQFDADLRVAVVMGKMGRLDEARAWLAGLQPRDEDQSVRLVQADAQLLRDLKRHAEAYDLFDKALATRPENVDLLYERAMSAEKINRLDVMEQDLRHIIKLKPDYAHAYNALGYTLADRTERHAEALVLLEKAIKLAPDDPFILDSMGWVLFKLKRFDEAISHLRRAHAARPDPEIAAHLGEVLWARGERDEARRVWQGGLREHPDNENLREVMSRLAQ